MNDLIVYKASAGSGKTFTLAVKYISQLIKYAAGYKNMLAVTFTNKATAEMKERILGQLYGIADNDANSEAYLKEVCHETGFTEDNTRERARMALKLMIHDYGQFHVETIDSFFQSIMRNLTRELNLTPNIEISLDNQQILSDAVDEMIEKQTPNSPELSWIMQFVEEKISNDKRWNPVREIKGFGINLFNEIYLKNGEALREKMKNPLFIANFNKKINALRTEKQKVFTDLHDKFDLIIKNSGIDISDISNGKELTTYFNRLVNKEFDKAEPGAHLRDKMNDAEKWCKKVSTKHDEIISLAENSLISLLEEAEKKRKTDGKDIISCDLTLQQIYKVGLLNTIDKEVIRLNNEHNRFLLSNTSDLLHRIIGDSDTSFIFEKVGTVIRNVMIDEFQDTSQLQWDNFKLLLLECLSKGEQSLLVGDVKQSIYRWRNSDWNILNKLKGHIDNFPIEVEKLDTNRRSEANIINFNNDLFTHAVEWFKTNYGEERCQNLINAYSDVVQKTVDQSKEPKGFVGISFLDGKDDYDATTLEQLANTVNDLIAQGLKMNEITILIRKKKYIPGIAKYFEENYPQYSIVSDEAFQLQSSSAIQMTIDAMRCIDDKDNKIAKAHLAINYQHNVLHKDIAINALLINDLNDYLPKRYIDETDILKMMSIYELTEKIFIMFGIDKMDGQDNYLFSFMDAIQDYAAEYPSDIGQFLEYWDETLCTQTIPAGNIDGIRIISIHASKGLEFHTVLIPYCDWSLENETYDQLVWCKPKEKPFDEMPLVPMNYSKKMSLSTYKDDYDKEQLQLWVDNLNLLYVAFTRAKKNLIVWCQAGYKRHIPELLGECLSAVDNNFTAQPNETYTYGTLYLEHEKEKADKQNIIEQQPIPEEIKMKTYEQKNISFRQSNKSADFIEGEESKSEKYIQEGLLMHQLFADIETINDIEPKIQSFVDDGIINTKDIPRIKKLTEYAVNNPKVRDWYDGQNEIINEREIIWRDENGKLVTRRPDRVMKRDGRITIVDFKFGTAKPEYEEQMKGYMTLIHQIGYDEVEGYLWYVYKNNILKVEE